jgi:hypothetical protein
MVRRKERKYNRFHCQTRKYLPPQKKKQVFGTLSIAHGHYFQAGTPNCVFSDIHISTKFPTQRYRQHNKATA